MIFSFFKKKRKGGSGEECSENGQQDSIRYKTF